MVRRPTAAPKSKSKLRISFDPGQSTEADVVPTIAKPSRLGASVLSTSLPHHVSSAVDRPDSDRPAYSKSYLDELKGSTPTTPRDLSLYNSSAEDEPPANRALDVASKFGTSTSLASSAIPSAAEIQEKKDRRARLAKEQQATALSSTNGGSIGQNDDYVSLDAYDSDGEFKPSRLQVASYSRADQIQSAQEHTRLVPEDEDIAEGFDDFVDDSGSNRLLMSRANQRNQDTRDRESLRVLIDQAEGASLLDDDMDDDSDDSDASLKLAYNAAQTSHGTTAFGQNESAAKTRRRVEREAMRPRQPEKTTSVLTLAAALSRLREVQEQAEHGKQRAEIRKAEIERRLNEVEGEKGRIQKGLEELGKQLEETKITAREDVDGRGQNGRIDRGLDSIGGE